MGGRKTFAAYSVRCGIRHSVCRAIIEEMRQGNGVGATHEHGNGGIKPHPACLRGAGMAACLSQSGSGAARHKGVAGVAKGGGRHAEVHEVQGR